jgi:hypothetical protein
MVFRKERRGKELALLPTSAAAEVGASKHMRRQERATTTAASGIAWAAAAAASRGGDKPSIASTRFLDKPLKNRSLKEPAPHTEPQTQWVMCKGTCKVEFGWSVESQAHYRTHNRPPPRFCLFCADERNKRKRARANDT